MKSTLSFWMWIYVLSKFLLGPFELVRSWHHPADRLYVGVLTLLVAVGVAAALLILLPRHAALPFVGADLLLRFFLDIEFYVHHVLHPLREPRSPGVHAAAILMITLILGLVPNCLWFLYFNQSRRVRSRFGNNLLSGLLPPPR